MRAFKPKTNLFYLKTDTMLLHLPIHHSIKIILLWWADTFIFRHWCTRNVYILHNSFNLSFWRWWWWEPSSCDAGAAPSRRKTCHQICVKDSFYNTHTTYIHIYYNKLAQRAILWIENTCAIIKQKHACFTPFIIYGWKWKENYSHLKLWK